MKFKDERLTTMFSDMEIQNHLYKPTNFWNKDLIKLTNSLENSGIENFRSNKLANIYFCPLYSSKLYRRYKGIFTLLISPGLSR
jgi:hypothetical protein